MQYHLLSDLKEIIPDLDDDDDDETMTEIK